MGRWTKRDSVRSLFAGSGARVWLATVCALAVAVGSSGCTSRPEAAQPAQEPSASAVPRTADGLGPTEQPALPTAEGEIDEDIELATGIVVALESVTTATVEAETPGDVAGDAVEVVVVVTNTSSETQSVESAVVTLETPEGDLGIPTIAGGASPLSGDIAPEKTAEGRYLFMLDPVRDRDVVVSVNYAAGEPVAQFTGRTP